MKIEIFENYSTQVLFWEEYYEEITKPRAKTRDRILYTIFPKKLVKLPGDMI
jgi:hypothetical protein